MHKIQVFKVCDFEYSFSGAALHRDWDALVQFIKRCPSKRPTNFIESDSSEWRGGCLRRVDLRTLVNSFIRTSASVSVTLVPSLLDRLVFSRQTSISQVAIWRDAALRVWSSSRNCLDSSEANHLYHGTLQTLYYLTIYPVYLGYNVHPLLLGIKVCYKNCFPPQFELMQNWSSFHQASCLCLWTNQRPLHRFMNCGGNPALILYYLMFKNWGWTL